MPFKRFQIQPVWRADRPQKGRFREFFQCDADVVGSKSLWQEIEFVQLYDAVFDELGLRGTTVKLNNRKILSGIAEIIGAKDKLIDFTVALDKLDKIGSAGVTDEMLAKGISAAAIEKITPLFSFTGTNGEKLDQLQDLLANSEEGLKGVQELRFVIEKIDALPLESTNLELDVTLARGLNYYTGAIFEVAAPEGVQMGAVGGGGRYDDLTGIFGLKDMSGVGISFGLDRIYLVMEELNLFKTFDPPRPDVVFVNFGDEEALYCTRAIQQLRRRGVKAELYPDSAKMKKQMNYANKREIPFVVLVGSKEIQANTYTLKNMQSGTQQECNFDALLEVLNNS
jgi:histidyl-tRNA synthetase